MSGALSKVKCAKNTSPEWAALRIATTRAAMLTQVKADVAILEECTTEYFTKAARLAKMRISAALEIYHETWDREESLNG